MDGVLVDTEPLYSKHRINYSKKRWDVDIDESFMQSARGLSSRSFWEKLFGEFNITHSIEEAVIHARADYLEFLKNHAQLKPIEGIIDLIEKLHKKDILLGIASSSSLTRIIFILQLLKVKDKFKTIISSDDVENGKPYPDIYLKAAEKLGVDPKGAVAVEDATNGVKSAKAAGMKVIAFKDPKHNVQDLSEADLIIKSFSEINLHKLQKLIS